jgi:chromosome segregation ATPase
MSSISGSDSSDTSGSGSDSPEASSELASDTTGKVGGQSTLTDSLRVSGSSIMSAPVISSSSSSESPPKKPKPMDINEEINCLKDSIKKKDATLTSLSNEIKKFAEERRALRKLPETIQIGLQLKDIDEDLPDMRRERDRLVAEITKHEAELSQLINPKELVDAPVPAQGT